MNNLLSLVPGFRTNTLWKKIVSVIGHSIIIFIVLMLSMTYLSRILGANKIHIFDLILEILSFLFNILIFFVIPYILLTNVMHLRDKFHIFKGKKILGFIGETLISIILIFSISIAVNLFISNFYTTEYQASWDANDKSSQQNDDNGEVRVQEAVVDKENETTQKLQTSEVKKLQDNKIENLEKYLLKHDIQSIISLYNSADSDFKTYIEEKVNDEYMDFVKSNLSSIKSKDNNTITKMASELEFVNSLVSLKSKDIGKVFLTLNEIKNEFYDIEKMSSQLNEKDYLVGDIEDLYCYVRHNIKSGNKKIGPIYLENDEYTDMYFVSSYKNNEFLGILPTDDWEAVLNPKDTVIDQEGVYKLKVIRTGTETLIDDKGFRKEYDVYTEVTQDDIDRYNQIDELNRKIKYSQNKYNSKMNELIEYLTNQNVDIFSSLEYSEKRNLNIFLSNFSEIYMEDFDANNFDDSDLILFGIEHNILNNNNRINYDSDYNSFIEEKFVLESINKYFGIKEVENRSFNQYEYRNGKYFWPAATGEQYWDFSQVNKLYDNKDGTFTAIFDVYSKGFELDANDIVYDPKEMSWGNEINPDYMYSGKAVIKKVSNNNKETYKLIKYNVFKNDI